MTQEQAWTLLKEYNQDEFHLEHAEIVGKTMRYFAEKLGYGDEKDFWEVVGILHDLDFEKYPDQHCIKEQEILKKMAQMKKSSTPRQVTVMQLLLTSNRNTKWKRYFMPLTN